MSLKTVSLFSGVGGIDRGLETAGATTALLCEIDPHARKILARHYPNAAIHNDVTELTADDCRAAGAVPERTVLTAGFPCQDLSVAGRRRGMGEGTRSGLYWHVDRLLAEFRPAWVILENVPGLLSAACPCPGDGTCSDTCPGELHAVPGGACEGGCIAVHGGTMGAVLGSLAERGYGFAYRVLDARYFGVPQRRRRVVIVGRLGDTGAAAAQVLLEPEGVPGDPAAGITPRSVAAADAGEGAPGGDVVGALTARYGKGTDSDATDALVVGVLGAVAYVADQVTALDTAQGGPDDNTAQGGQLVAFALRGREDGALPEVHEDGGTVGSLRAAEGGSSRDYIAVATPIATRGQVEDGGLDVGEPNGPFPTLRAGDGGSSRNPQVMVETASDTIVRRLTPMECERLQGFPDGWTDQQADTHRYKQMGNSVAVPVFEWVGRRLVAVDEHLGETA